MHYFVWTNSTSREQSSLSPRRTSRHRDSRVLVRTSSASHTCSKLYKRSSYLFTSQPFASNYANLVRGNLLSWNRKGPNTHSSARLQAKTVRLRCVRCWSSLLLRAKKHSLISQTSVRSRNLGSAICYLSLRDSTKTFNNQSCNSWAP